MYAPYFEDEFSKNNVWRKLLYQLMLVVMSDEAHTADCIKWPVQHTNHNNHNKTFFQRQKSVDAEAHDKYGRIECEIRKSVLLNVNVAVEFSFYVTKYQWLYY